VVAVKEFLTASQAEHTGETVGAHGGYEEDDLITQADAMFLFRYLVLMILSYIVYMCMCLIMQKRMQLKLLGRCSL
jgi:hypothetical protein